MMKDFLDVAIAVGCFCLLFFFVTGIIATICWGGLMGGIAIGLGILGLMSACFVIGTKCDYE